MESIDVVVATYNRPAPLERCLEGLAAQSLGPFRVIVVDDCSDVPVSEWLDPANYPFELVNLRTKRNSGPANARNLAVSLSSSKYVAFVDDDVVVESNSLSLHLDAAQRNGPRAAVIGPLLPPPNWRPTPWTRWEAATIGVEYRRMAAGVYEPTWRQFFTGNALVSRAAFVAAGGFNESFARAEDIELGYRLSKLGCPFVFEPRAIGWHFAERTLASWRAIPRQYARFDLEIDREHPEICWSDHIVGEIRRRNTATRVAGAILQPLKSEQLGASVAIFFARGMNLVGLSSRTTSLLSLAFQLEYQSARRNLLDKGRSDQA